MGFTKLDENILDSSIMAESPETFKVWICLLAACREDGIARISSVGVASRCYLSIDVAKKSLDILQSPDSESRSTNDNGIRVRRVDGGFEIVNYFKYRAYLYSDNHEAVKKRKQRNGGQKGTCPQMSPNSGDISASASASVFEGDARGNFVESKVNTISDDLFDRFWKQYPKKVGKGYAEKSWSKIKSPNETISLITDALFWQIKCEQWTKDGGQFIPNPATYLNQKRWLDENVEIKQSFLILENLDDEARIF